VDVISESEFSDGELSDCILSADRSVCSGCLVTTEKFSISFSLSDLIFVDILDLLAIGFWREGPQTSKTLFKYLECNLITLGFSVLAVSFYSPRLSMPER
jgi:hypothetical protein